MEIKLAFKEVFQIFQYLKKGLISVIKNQSLYKAFVTFLFYRLISVK